jgi:hypothetical protein
LLSNVLRCADQPNHGSFVVADGFHDRGDEPHFAIGPEDANVLADGTSLDPALFWALRTCVAQ